MTSKAYVRIDTGNSAIFEGAISEELAWKIFKWATEDRLGTNPPEPTEKDGQCKCGGLGCMKCQANIPEEPSTNMTGEVDHLKGTEAGLGASSIGQEIEGLDKKPKMYEHDPTVIAKGKDLLAGGMTPNEVQKTLEGEFDITLKYHTVFYWKQMLDKDAKEEKARAELIKKGEKAEEKLETAENEKVEATEKKPKDRYAGYKLVQARDNDLAIVDDRVTCPVEKRAVDVDTTCRDGCDYGAYIALIRHTGTKKPHVRCGRA